METAVIEMLKRSAAIPSMPQVAARFLELIQDPDFDYREVVEVLSSDAGTAGEILRLANSSLFGVTRHVSSLSQAMTLLGIRRVRSLVLGRYIVDSLDRKRPTRLDISYFWRRSLTCAALAGRFAAEVEPQLREEAFISGLLADVGVVVLDEAMPTDYAPVAAQYRPDGECDLAHKEISLVGITHAQASALVLGHWQLPEVVCEAVNWHPLEVEGMEAPPLARVVGAADLLGKHLCDTQPRVDRILEVCEQLDEKLRIGTDKLAAGIVEVEPHLLEFAQMLRIDVAGWQAYQKLAADLQATLEPVGTA
ncbi:MAG TPA: HDOD domain-containing protein [Phycisphaerae bacterium]|nr:HDOD domain-containing protein [Phycisphaerae bacterium]HOJ75459.1 HDOD domain-containing protein [Phycisphaerae bacterium]HOM52259.1 HDOD domain-containing protein [Phycisphaerae bacterium]HON67575.1 HDOD domain-containing protein [Phycisphaerae bacterium]HOQ84153.1 HDOD domain-containing protein [Phycisphaerae bacterium]